MEEQNYVTLTKKIMTCIFSNKDIKNVIPYLSKNIKSMGLYTQNILTYQDMIQHMQ